MSKVLTANKLIDGNSVWLNAQGEWIETIADAFSQAYENKPLIRMTLNWPKVDDVAHTPFCDIAWKFDAESQYLVVTSAIDNLLKGAASQALQCANIAFGLPSTQGLI